MLDVAPPLVPLALNSCAPSLLHSCTPALTPALTPAQGMDYDYTLAGYTRHLPSTIYDLAKEHLVSLARPAAGWLFVASCALATWHDSAC